MAAPLQHKAQELSSRLPPLLIEAERVAQTVMQGTHGRRRAGPGETFWQFRRYEQGDPAERIDWRQSSRTDKIFIREREYEASQSAYVWADTSGSMHYSSASNLQTKAERAQLLMLALSDLMLRGGEKVTWLDRRSITAHGKNGLKQLASRLGSGQGDSAPPDIPIARHAHVILCSDFLMPPEHLMRMMQRYAALNLSGVIVHVTDPAENDFTFEGRIDMRGLENEMPVLLPNAGSLREAYLREFAVHKERVMHAAQSAGWFYTSHITTELPHLALLRIYDALASKPRSA
ncbi:MAG TPA: DUF58 domain-containing protein [Alphaproteobacteria bacterium]|nr:DUF58 domain-containing protein [Alphaproteobacteria bacterium]